MEDRLLSSRDLADSGILPVTKETLDAWRYRRQGPPYVKVGRLVFYRPEEVRAWLARRVVRPEAP